MAQTSTRFALSVHILTLLAQHRGQALTSTFIAEKAGANPAFIRRIICDLTRAGLTKGRLGKDGGAILAKGPKRISLLDVYQAVEKHRPAPALRKSAGKPSDAVSEKLPAMLGQAVEDAENAFFEALDRTSLKQLVKSVA